MKLDPSKLECSFARYGFAVQHLLSSSDCVGLAQADLLSLADENTRCLWDNLTLGYAESLGLKILP